MLPFFKSKLNCVMDFIKLERVQPFATAPEPQLDSSSTSSAMSVSPSPSPSSSSSSANNANNNQANGNKLSKKQKKAVKNAQAAAAMQRAQKRANQAKSAQKEKQRNSAQQLATPRASPRPPSPVRYTQSHLSVAPSQPNENGPLEVDMRHLKVSLDNVTGLALRRNCNRIIEPNTLPDDIIPTIARSEEVSAYQNQFTLPRTELGKRTIGQLLQTFSPVTPIKGKTEVYSKLQFVYNLIQRVANLDKVRPHKYIYVCICSILLTSHLPVHDRTLISLLSVERRASRPCMILQQVPL